MSRIRSSNTGPEMIIRMILRKSGFRYRINYPVYGKPDIIFPKNKIAIFIHGCFWHQHGCNNSVIPKTNTKFWKEKLSKNIERDRIVAARLKEDKWIQLIVWECETEDNHNETIRRLISYIKNYVGKNTEVNRG